MQTASRLKDKAGVKVKYLFSEMRANSAGNKRVVSVQSVYDRTDSWLTSECRTPPPKCVTRNDPPVSLTLPVVDLPGRNMLQTSVHSKSNADKNKYMQTPTKTIKRRSCHPAAIVSDVQFLGLCPVCSMHSGTPSLSWRADPPPRY